MGFLMPKVRVPEPAPIIMPKTEDVPKADDPAVKQAEQDKLRRQEIARKGRRSTILTGTGLTTPADLEKKTLLG